MDDKPESIRVFREALEASGRYSILESATGEQALDLIQRSGKIDLVILDLRMPGTDGFEVLQALRANDQTAHTPVLVLTAEEVTAEERASLKTVDIYPKDTLETQDLLRQVDLQLGVTREK